MRYEDFFTAQDVATYKRVKLGTMLISRYGREIAAAMVGGTIPRKGKQFITTRKGVFRLAMGANSDNTTEVRAHWAMGVKTVFMGDDKDMSEFFTLHDLPWDAVYIFHKAIKVRLSNEGT